MQGPDSRGFHADIISGSRNLLWIPSYEVAMGQSLQGMLGLGRGPHLRYLSAEGGKAAPYGL